MNPRGHLIPVFLVVVLLSLPLLFLRTGGYVNPALIAMPVFIALTFLHFLQAFYLFRYRWGSRITLSYPGYLRLPRKIKEIACDPLITVRFEMQSFSAKAILFTTFTITLSFFLSLGVHLLRFDESTGF